MKSSREIKIVDVTLREGDQAPMTSFNAREKAMIALMLSELGVDVIEVGFGASRADFENIKTVSKIVGDRKTVVSSLGRALENDTTASLEALENIANPRIHIFLAMSKEHIEQKFKKPGESLEETRQRLIEQAKTEIKRAKNWVQKNNKNLEIEFSPEDATGNALITSPQPSPLGGEGVKKKVFNLKNNPDFDFLIKVCEEAIKSGATIINIPDTLGNLLPYQTYEFFKEVSSKLEHLRGPHPSPLLKEEREQKEVYKFGLSCHIHNDLAISTANAIEAVRGGASYIESTLLGIGERAGNTATNEIIGIFKEKGDDLGVSLNENINYKLIGPISSFVKNILGFDKFLQTPFIGALSDTDGSGVHNAAKDLYGGSKNKAQFGGEVLPEFFSPRGGANQIVNMLENFGVMQDKKSEIIQKVTQKAAKVSEIVKALYTPNIYKIYLEESGNFEIKKLDIENKKLDLEINLKGKTIKFSGETSGEDGVIKTFVEELNKYFKKEFVKIKELKVKSKPSLKQEYEKFLLKVNNLQIKLNKDFENKAKEILAQESSNDEYSSSYGINQVILEVGGKEVYSNSYDKNVTIGNLKAILEGVLSYL